MTKQIFYLIAVLTGLMFGRIVSANEPMQMTLTLKPDGEVVLIMAGSGGTVTIDWGDGSASKTHLLMDYNEKEWQYDGRKYGFNHTYSGNNSEVHTITIIGNVTHLDCSGMELTDLDVSNNTVLTDLECLNNQLTSLDVSKNSMLKTLACSNNRLTSLDVSKMLIKLWCSNNQLTNLDVSKNTALTEINCQNNQLETDALNALFETLPEDVDSIGKKICARNNPGTKTCNQSIATSKGWAVVDSKELKFTFGGSMPLFNGKPWEEGFRDYFTSNTIYPKEALKNGIQGIVKVKFIVNSQGKVINAEVIQSVHPLLDAEALRVVNSSSKWTPAIQGGKKVNTKLTVPFAFKL